jgi:hypothetical protein
MNKLAVVSFENPYPPDYGGSMDIYYLLVNLHRIGVEVELHSYSKHKPKISSDLNRICSEVHYYPRRMHLWNAFISKPFVVKSRENTQLVKRLLKFDRPVLLEGLHCSDVLNYKDQFNKKIALRTHNIEHEYYNNLYLEEFNFFKKSYFYLEKKRLEKYESILSKADALYSISLEEKEHFERINSSTLWIPAFHPNDKVVAKEGLGDYCLFHANLSVSENHKAASWLIKNVFSKIEHRCLIAGKQPGPALAEQISKFKNIELIEDPSEDEMALLVKNAHINVLRVRRPSGVKLKLLNSLFQGRHCIANAAMVEGTGLEEAILIAETSEDYISRIDDLFEVEFSAKDILNREELLSRNFSNMNNAKKIIEDLDIAVKV